MEPRKREEEKERMAMQAGLELSGGLDRLVVVGEVAPLLLISFCQCCLPVRGSELWVED